METKSKKTFLWIVLALILIGSLYLVNRSLSPAYRVVYENSTMMPMSYFCPQDDCMGILQNLTDASNRVDCAFYDLDLEELIGEFESKGAGVRIVMDHDNYNDNKEKLKGIADEIRVAIPNHQMHNKFCIFDDNIVATGSFNPTIRGNFKNNNNLVVIESHYLAKNYEDEFDELWKGVYSRGKKVRYPEINLDGRTIEDYFCPDDCSPEIYTKLIDKAEQSVYFMAFSFTRDDIGDALISAGKRGVDIRGVMERSQDSQWSEYKRLKDAGIDVRWDTNPANMHHKVFIIDGNVVMTGSANPTGNGIYHNDENIIVLHDRLLADGFMEEFSMVYNQNLNK